MTRERGLGNQRLINYTGYELCHEPDALFCITEQRDDDGSGIGNIAEVINNDDRQF